MKQSTPLSQVPFHLQARSFLFQSAVALKRYILAYEMVQRQIPLQVLMDFSGAGDGATSESEATQYEN
eukprot:IDg9485t1